MGVESRCLVLDNRGRAATTITVLHTYRVSVSDKFPLTTHYETLNIRTKTCVPPVVWYSLTFIYLNLFIYLSILKRRPSE